MGRAALVVSGGILLSRLLGFLRDVALSAVLGATGSGDVYDAAFVLPDFLFYLVAGGYLSITFIPILSRYLAEGDTEGGWRAFTAVFRLVAVVVVSLTLVALVFAGDLVAFAYERFPDFVGSLTGAASEGGLSADQISDVVTLARIALPAQVFFVLGGLYMAVSYTHERFLVPTLAPIIYNISIMLFGIALRDSAIPASGFVWGALIGAFLGHFVLQRWGAKRVGLTWIRGTAFWHPAVSEYVVLSIPLMLGQSLVVLEEQLVRIFAQFGESGSIFALGRARRLNMLPVGVIAQAAGVAAYPFLARLAAERRLTELGATLLTAARYVIVASAGATAALLALSQPIVRVALQRANFTASATILTASALVWFSLSITAWGIQQVYARAFYAMRQMWTPVLIGTTATLVALPLMVTLSDEERMGVIGLALASSLAVTGYAVALFLVWHQRTGFRDTSGVLRTAARSLLSASAAGLAGWKVADLILSETGLTFPGSLLAVLVGLLVVSGVYLGLSWLLGSPELRQLAGRLSPR